MELIEPAFIDQIERAGKHILGFGRETRDYIGTERHSRRIKRVLNMSAGLIKAAIRPAIQNTIASRPQTPKLATGAAHCAAWRLVSIASSSSVRLN